MAATESAERPDTLPPPQSATARLFTRIGKRDDDLATQEGRMDELRAYSREHARWRAYRTFCQFRFGYFAFLVFMVIVMFSSTLLMEIFFAIFLPSAKYDDNYVVRSIALLVALPLVLFVLSYCFEEANRLFFDAIDKTDGSLPNFRIALAVVIHYARHRHEMRDPRAEAHNRSDSEATGTTDDSAGPGARRNTVLLMAAADGPFDDTGKDDEDLAWELRQEKAEDDVAAAATEPGEIAGDAQMPFAMSIAAKRWKRVRAAVFAARLIKKVEYDGPPFDVSTFVIVDVVCSVLFEVATAVALVLEFLASWSPAEAFLAYVQMGFWTLSAYLVVWVATHFVSSRNGKMRLLVSNYRRSRRLTTRAVYELERHKRAEHLWLLDVGFRFYYHVVQKVNPGTWCPSRVRHTAELTVQTTISSNNNTVQPVTIIDVQSPGGRSHNGRHSPVRATVANKVHALTTAHAQLQARNPWHRLANTRKAAVLLVLVIAAALLSLYSFVIGWPIMGVLLIALSSVIQQLFPQIFGRAFRDFIKAFVVLSFVFFSSTFAIGAFASGESFVLGPFVNTTTVVDTSTSAVSKTNTLAFGLQQQQQTSEYPACTIDYDGLTVLDLALIADAAYGNSTAVQHHALANRFDGTALSDWTYVARNNESTDHQVWMELYFASVNMTVVAVRGTASATDALEDLHYWFGITIMQALDVFVPFLQQLPRAFVVKLLSMDLITSVMPAPVYVPLLEHVARVRARVGDNVVVTGHSLGGAMAAMVGAKTQTRAVSFSGPGPGLIYSRGRFGVDASDLRDYVLTFKPRKDIVPRVDALGGMVQELRCKHKSPMACHGTLTHVCELYLACGDSRKRNWATNKQCNAYQALPEDTEEDA